MLRVFLNIFDIFSMFFDMQDRSNNRLKMGTLWVPGGPLGTPWNLPGDRPGPFSGEIGYTCEKLTILERSRDVPGCPGNPADPQKSTKN